MNTPHDDASSSGAPGSGAATADAKASGASTEITWIAAQRVAHVRYARGANLTSADGDVLTDALTGWIGAEGVPFAVLADAAGLHGTDAAYRAKASAFLKQHRDHAFIALINVGPVIQVVVELFRLGTGIPLKTFGNEEAARTWLRAKGIAA